MEARPDQLYGNSLRLDIPRLEIKNVRVGNSMSPSCFLRSPLTLLAPESEEMDRGDELNAVLKSHPRFIPNVQANEVIILMINSFVDFFIQYYCPGYNREQNPLILKLKEIIFYSTNERAAITASGYDTLVMKINHELEAKYPAILSQWPPSETYFFPKNVGRQFEYNREYIEELKTRLEVLTEELRRGPTMPLHNARLQEEVDATKLYLDDKLFPIFTTSNYQKFEIFYLLFLSYHVLSMSGIFFDIEIQDLDEILRQEFQREKQNSFILQFLPYNPIIINIIKTQFLTFFMTNSICMPALRELKSADASERGGSKRILKKYNKSRKNKPKNKYKKSRKNKRHRRKRTQNKRF
jgi:hypothetical protein